MYTATKTSSIDTASNTNWQVDPAIKTNKQIKTATKPTKKDGYNNQN